MAVAAQEQTANNSVEYLEQLFDLRPHDEQANIDVRLVSEVVDEEIVRLEAACFASAIILDKTVEYRIREEPIRSLREGIHRAAAGDPVAKKMVRSNAGTDAVERSLKTGIVLKPIELELTPDGKRVQHGQTSDSVQANGLKVMMGHPIMEPRTRAENRNDVRIDLLNQQGYLDQGYVLAVFSLAENIDNLFFTDTMSCSIQVTSKKEQTLLTESAFVSAIKTPGEERHDFDTIVKLYSLFGVDISSKSQAEIIDAPLLIHSSFIKNGAIDLVRLWDHCAGGTFFGEDKPAEDYLDYLDKCRLIEASFGPKIDLITEELIKEAPLIKTDLQAIQRLDKISEKHMVDYAIDNNYVNARVFGKVSAKHIEDARYYQAVGDEAAAASAREEAIRTAQSFSCPTVLGLGSEQDEMGSLKFSCDNCGHMNERPMHQLIDNCAACGLSVKC